MQLIMGGINGSYLSNTTENCVQRTEQVLAAVAYASDSALLFDWCWQNRKPLKFYGRLDDTVPVTMAILADYLKKASPDFVCRLVQHHHAKIIWWRGAGIYIGSANLTGSAWYKNVEAGYYFSDEEISDEMAADILAMFKVLETNSTPLTDELLQGMRRRSRLIDETTPDPRPFWESPSFKKWLGLVQTTARKAGEASRGAR
jgi:phosphatidylserine/phosphatidylglycerophosphate/cardiolipin synthase-like enzyme